MLAASSGHVEMMQLLIQHGVAVKAKDRLGRTAMQYTSNAAAAEFLERQANETVPYPGKEWLELRVDTGIKQGAGGSQQQRAMTKSANVMSASFCPPSCSLIVLVWCTVLLMDVLI